MTVVPSVRTLLGFWFAQQSGIVDSTQGLVPVLHFSVAILVLPGDHGHCILTGSKRANRSSRE